LTTEKFTKWQRTTLAAVSVVYALVRFWDMTASCLWFDEIFGVNAAEHSWGDMFWFVASDLIHPPFFYAALKIWTQIGGEGLLWLRSFSVSFSILSIPPFLYLCRELKLKFSTTVVALVFFSLNGALIKYAQEVRMYGMLLFLSLVSIWLFARFFYRGKNVWVLTAVNVLLVYTHYFGWLVLLCEVVAILAFQRIKIRHVLIMLGINLAAFVPWLMLVWKAGPSAVDLDQNVGWIERPAAGELFRIALKLFEPFYFQQSSVEPHSLYLVAIPLLVLVVAAMALYVYRFREAEDKSAAYIFAIFAVVPLAFAFIGSWLLPVSVWGSRHLIVVFPPAIILAAIFLTDFPRRGVRNAFFASLAILVSAAFVVRVESPQPNYVWCAWEQLAPEIKGTGDQKLYVFEDLIAYQFWFVTRGRADLHVIKVNDLPGVNEDRAYFLPRGFTGVQTIKADAIQGDNFWVAFRGTTWDPNEQPLDYLKSRGYTIGQPRTIEAQAAKAFLVEVSK
jgi:uncharacterized membrane protein